MSDPAAPTVLDATNPLATGLEADRHSPPVAMVVFGASGDLAHRKIFPALASLSRRRALSSTFSVIGVARTPLTDEQFRDLVLESAPDGGPEWKSIVGHFRYVAGEYAHPDTFDQLKVLLAELDDHVGTSGNRVYYLATIPALFSEVALALGQHGLSRPKSDETPARWRHKPRRERVGVGTGLVRARILLGFLGA